MSSVAASRLPGVVRFGVSLGVAGLVGALIWLVTPDQLEPPINIIGYPTFVDFDFHRQFLAYRLAMWELPLVTLAVWWLLGHVRPFAIQRRTRPERVLLSDAADNDVAEEGLAHRRADGELAVRGVTSWWRYLRLLPTAIVVTLVVSGGGGGRPDRHVTALGVVGGAVLVAVLLACAGLVCLAIRGHTDRSLPECWDRSLAVTHAYLGATVSLAALTWSIRHSSVRLQDGHVVFYAWLAWWVAVVVWLALVVALLWRGRRTGPVDLEGVVVRVVVGSVFVYLVTSQMSSQIGPIQGFDDMQSVTGADLLSRGYFPWRDFLFIHGLFEDALRSSLGFALFGHSLWATVAVIGVVWIPLTWLGVYWVGAWASRGRAAPLLACLALLIWVAAHVQPSYRWVGMSVVWVLLGAAIRHAGGRWTVLLTAVLFCQAVLVPEASFQVIGTTVALVGSDLTHRADGAGWWRALVRTRAFVGTGIVCSLVWCGFLATHHALSAFIDYYLVFGPGHAESGALPIPTYGTHFYITFFVICVVVAGLTLWFMGAALVGRRSLSSVRWVAFAVAITTALYAEKGLARFDDGHLMQVVTVALPLLAIWLILGLTWLDDRIWALVGARVPAGRRRTSPWRTFAWWPDVGQPVSVVAAVLMVCTFPVIYRSADAASGHNSVLVSGVRFPKLGWSSTDALDQVRLHDLRRVVNAYTTKGPVFDFTNSPGYFYYLLGEDPPTTFYHVSMAVPAFTQETVISQLKKTRPELVVFDAPFGLPSWDGPHNEVRHYDLSQYLLDGWSPVLRTHGVLFLVRDDLLNQLPPPPRLQERPELKRLWFAAPLCDFGDTANFLESKPTGTSLKLDVAAPQRTRRIDFRGWTYDAVDHRPARHAVVAAGGVVIDSLATTEARPDVAAVLGEAGGSASGFSGGIDTRRRGPISFYAIGADGVAHPIGDTTAVRTELLRPGRSPIPVSSTPATGSIDQVGEAAVDVSEIHLPSGTDLSKYELMDLSSTTGDIGTAQLEVASSPKSHFEREQRIVADALPEAGDSLDVRVGSCLQWHGYRGDTLYLTQNDVDHPIDRVTLSRVGA